MQKITHEKKKQIRHTLKTTTTKKEQRQSNRERGTNDYKIKHNTTTALKHDYDNNVSHMDVNGNVNDNDDDDDNDVDYGDGDTIIH